jgi:hypothetical protein
MKTCLCFCKHLECNSLNIFIRVKDVSSNILLLFVNLETLFFRSFLNSLLLLEREFQKYLIKQLETCKKHVCPP